MQLRGRIGAIFALCIVFGPIARAGEGWVRRLPSPQDPYGSWSGRLAVRNDGRILVSRLVDRPAACDNRSEIVEFDVDGTLLRSMALSGQVLRLHVLSDDSVVAILRTSTCGGHAVTRLAEDGRTLWTSRRDGVGTPREAAIDGNSIYVVAEQRNPGIGGDSLIWKLSESGDTEWARLYDHDSPVDADDEPIWTSRTPFSARAGFSTGC